MKLQIWVAEISTGTPTSDVTIMRGDELHCEGEKLYRLIEEKERTERVKRQNDAQARLLKEKEVSDGLR